MLEIKFKINHEKAKMPKQAHPTDAGADLTAVSKQVMDNYIEYDTGIAVQIPEGHVGLLFPRSSCSDTSLILANSVGVIDSDYRGNVKVRFKRVIGHSGIEYEAGDRVAQLVVLPIPRLSYMPVEKLDETSRGAGGFGSSGL